ncbi:glycoside hydrolase family 16 protein [Bythopirellula polymerisocia]|uniref:Beta-glucanase n=1 Tax=Bythopirellula polymerisocia TaxID=2528003 RepID=A0A5C6D0W9_9BACT|nr:glycoside hydrolase family 16 protein [Bythopirellula polymerisocia]TWU29825.1 Beta-glucanase precursor [Bythopirellula polymerisocia]
MRLTKPFLPQLTTIALCCFVVAETTSLHGQVLLLDNFDDTSGPAAAQGDGIVDISKFRAPFGGFVGAGDFAGRTQFRFTLPSENVPAGVAGSTDGKVAVLNLDTFDSVTSTPGTSFLGTDLITKQNFARGGGLRMTTRMRVDASTAAQGGIVAAPFLYDVSRGVSPNLVRDEIDHELLTNESVSGTPNRTFTNVWNDGPFTGPGSGGSPQFINNPSGFDITKFHDYRTDWTPSSVKYYIDGALVRTETTVIPDDPMRAHVNFWVPDSGFVQAYDGSFVPAATSGSNTNFKLELDRLQVERFNTTTSANLLADARFEDGTSITFPPPVGITPANHVGAWIRFNNAFVDSSDAQGVPSIDDGFEAAKVYTPGANNASGFWQNVAASPGEEFEASVFAYAPSSDPILGSDNFTNITLQFLNSAGAVLDSVNFSPGRNQQDTPIYDGRDADMIQDEWVQYTVDALAPADTALVRMNLLFNSTLGQGGAVWFDNASLVKLTSNAPTLSGDFDGDGDVDGRDFLVWQRNTAVGNLADWQANYGTPLVAAVSAVPEPGTCVLGLLLALGAGSLGRRRRTCC